MSSNKFIERCLSYQTLFNDYKVDKILVHVENIVLVRLSHHTTNEKIIAKGQFFEGYSIDYMGPCYINGNKGEIHPIKYDHYIINDENERMCGLDVFNIIPGFIEGAPYLEKGIDALKKRDYYLAFGYFFFGYSNDCVTSIVELGILYEKGLSVMENCLLAQMCYQKAIDLKSPYGYCRLGLMYECGVNCTKDYDKAFSYYQKAVDLNFGYGFYLKGALLENTQKYTHISEVVLCFDKANELGYDEAVMEYARCVFAYNFDVSYQEKAIEYLKEGHFKNVPSCSYYLGVCYQIGSGVKQNYTKSKLYLEKACSNYYYPAYIALSLQYRNGLGVEEDHIIERKLLLNAIKGGHMPGYKALIQYYKTVSPFKYSKLRMIYWVKKGVKLKDAYCYFEYSNLIYCCDIKTKDLTDIGRYLLYSAGGGCVEALLKSAELFKKGSFLLQNYELAGESYLDAKNLGSFEGAIGYAKMHLEGIGFEANFDYAKQLFEQSALEGNSEALVEIGLMYFNKDYNHYDLELARNYFEKGFYLSNGRAAFYIAKTYFACDHYEKGKTYLEESGKLGYGKAYYELYKLTNIAVHQVGYLEKAFELDYKKARFPLAQLYIDGYSEEFDEYDGVCILNEMFLDDDPDCYALLFKCLVLGIGCEVDGKKAIDVIWYPQDPYSHYIFGLIYYHGLNVPKNIFKAMKHFAIARKGGVKEALKITHIHQKKG